MKRRTKIAIACLSAITTLSTYAATHKGYVFVDANANGVFDKGEKPLKGVAVSDGLHVVQTLNDGSFSLPGHAKERFVFITTPSGYKSDNQHYRKIDAGRESYHFGLQPYAATAKNGSHQYLHIADTEIFNTNNHEEWVGNLRDYAANEKAAFIIHTGDICYENGLKNHIKLMNTRNMNCPTFYCIGNHDLVKGEYGEELFESLYGPTFYSFDVGNMHYIVTPMLGGDHRPSYRKEDVYRWMKNDLALVPKGKAVTVFNHDLLTHKDTFIYGINEKEFINLNEHNLKAWVYGHWHINYMKKQGDVYSVCTAVVDKGGIDHSTSVFRVMHIDEKGDFTSEVRYSYLDKSLCIASIANNRAPLLPSGALPLSVNVYSSASPVKEVTADIYCGEERIGKNQKLQQQTDWNWYAEMPLNRLTENQQVTVRVKAAFRNGETANIADSFAYSGTPQKVNTGKEWTNLLGNPEHIGLTGDTLKSPLTLAWVKNVKANIFMSSPLVYKDNVYVASVDENHKGQGAIFALESSTGNIRWKYKVRNSIKNTIAAAGGLILAQDAEGYLYAVDALTGTLTWEKKLPINPLPALIEGIVATDTVVYAGTGKGLCAIDVRSGNIRWTNTEWGQHEGTTSTWTLGNGVLVAGTQWGSLYGNNAQTGKMLWAIGKDGLSDRGASPAAHGNLLYLISRKSFFILDASTGNVIVRKELPMKVDVTSTPLVTDSEIIFGTSDSGLVAIDKETLEPKWNYQTGTSLVFTGPYTLKPAASIETSPVSNGNVVYVGASDGAIYGIDKTKGTLLWKHETGAPVFATVALSGNMLFAVDLSGNVYAFGAAGNL